MEKDGISHIFDDESIRQELQKDQVRSLSLVGRDQCHACLTSIPRGAKKCLACGSFQDWRRYFDFSAVILSLLIALFSVLATAIPVIHNALLPKSDVRVSLLNKDGDAFVVCISNLGTKPAMLGDVSLMLTPFGKNAESSVPVIPKESDRLITPNQWKTFTFVWRDITLDLSKGPVRKQLSATFHFIAFDHVPKESTILIDDL